TGVLSDREISSPVLNTFDTAVILNQQSLDKFEPKVKPGGTLIYDPYGIHRLPTRTDISIIPVNAMEATLELKNSKAYNMVLLGALLKSRGLVPIDAVMKGLKKTLPERHHHLLPLNHDAILKGMELVK
ncbi:MAG: 2-oxoacid:acceptor oxidoreductase family protein, partial [Duncaniella sp.]|nr:2-oxoacid:acceptor oxidoreductase family protein [Duncaniella sp.]